MIQDIYGRLKHVASRLNSDIDLYMELASPPADAEQASKVMLRIQMLQAELNLHLDQLFAEHNRPTMFVVK